MCITMLTKSYDVPCTWMVSSQLTSVRTLLVPFVVRLNRFRTMTRYSEASVTEINCDTVPFR